MGITTDIALQAKAVGLLIREGKIEKVRDMFLYMQKTKFAELAGITMKQLKAFKDGTGLGDRDAFGAVAGALQMPETRLRRWYKDAFVIPI